MNFDSPIPTLLEQERNEEASEMLRPHLQHTLQALAKIKKLLKP